MASSVGAIVGGAETGVAVTGTAIGAGNGFSVSITIGTTVGT